LLDVTGRLLVESKSIGGQQYLDLNIQSHQIVFVNIITESGDMITEKVYIR